MNKIYLKLQLGIDKPFSFFHMSDTHLALAERIDGERKVILAKERKRYFPYAYKHICEAADECLKTDKFLVHTGDLIDFTSKKNFQIAKKFIKRTNCFFVVGNHEFSQYVGEAFENEAYKEQSSALVQRLTPYDIRFASRIVNGINFVGIDNVYYYFLPDFVDKLKEEAAKDYPIILCLHNPLYEKTLFDNQIQKDNCAYLVGVPDNLISGYPFDRRVQQKANDCTKAALEFISKEKKVKAILAGHLHYDYEGKFAGTIPQIITGKDTLREIEII
jgi:metallophosphoesterase